MKRIHILSDINYNEMTATCKNCGKVKVHSKGYPYGKDKRLQVRCSNATGKDQHNGVRRLREAINQYKLTYGCSICGYAKCAGALDFHHPYKNKSESIGILVAQRNAKKLWAEVKKCVIVCANCHRELHYAEKDGKSRSRNKE